jgi:transposase
MSKSKPLRQNLGIDVSKDSLQVCISNQESDQRIRVIATTKFDNTAKGHNKLWAWICKHRISGVDFKATMEATGVYHESAAYFLHEHGLRVSVLLPNKSKSYAKSLNVKSKNDVVDARILAQMGLERILETWQPASGSMRRLKRLTRERVALQEHKTVILNQLHAIVSAHEPEKDTQKRYKQLLAVIKKQLKEIELEMQKTIEADEVLKRKVENICGVKGLGLITVATIIAETDGFALFKSKGQVVSYAGYDVMEDQSGNVKRPGRISGKGNRHIRKALHFPALVVVKHEDLFTQLFHRTFEKSRIKMKAYVAVQRKLLVLIYTLFKKDEAFDAKFHLRTTLEKQNRQELCPA